MTKVTTFTEYTSGEDKIMDVHNDLGDIGTLRSNNEEAHIYVKMHDEEERQWNDNPDDALINFLTWFFDFPE